MLSVAIKPFYDEVYNKIYSTITVVILILEAGGEAIVDWNIKATYNSLKRFILEN